MDTQLRLGSFTGFNPITGTPSSFDETETNEFLSGLPLSSPDSLRMKILRFENQFRIMGQQQATFELNSILHFWYENLPKFYDIPTTPSKSVTEMLEWVELLRPELQPNISTYQTLLDGFLKNLENMQTAEVILDHMLEVLLKKRRASNSSNANTNKTASDRSDNSLEITSVLYSFHKVMTVYGKAGNPFATERMLRRLEKTSHEYHIPLMTNETYSIAISNWTKNGKPREAEYVLYSMINMKDKTFQLTGTKIMPTKVNFDACLNAWVAHPSKSSGYRAELLVLKMLELSENGHDTKPNYKSYSKIVHAWVNSRHENGLARIGKIMEQLERMDWSSEADTCHIQQTVAETYLAAMRACSYLVRNKGAVTLCLDYFSRVDKVLGLKNFDYYTLQLMYAALIYTYAQSALPDTETHVQDLFAELDTRHQKFLADQSGEEEFDPYISIPVYKALLHAFAKTGSGQKAETVLKRMMNEYLDLMDQPAQDVNQLRKIDTNCFNSVLLAWSKSTEPDAGLQAEKLFRQMYQSQSSKNMIVRVDVVSYNAVLSAMAGTTNVDVARRGDAYFRQMLESSDPKCRATSITYTKAMALWSNIGTKEALQRADELLDEMKTSDNSHIQPTRYTYKTYLEVLKKCSSCLPIEEYHYRVRDTNRMIKSL